MPRCDHAAFRVADLDRSIAFYERVLPARVTSRVQHPDRWRTEVATLAPLGDDGFRLVLLMPRRVRWLLRAFHTLVPRQTRSHEHLGFAVASREELDERVAAAQAAGARVENALTQLAGREGREGREGRDAWLFEVLDPDGNAVEWIFGDVHA